MIINTPPSPTSTFTMFSSTFNKKRVSSQHAHHPSPAPDPRYGHRQSVNYGPGYHHPHGPPQGADPQLWQWFVNVDRDRSGSITVDELQNALVNGKQSLQL